MPHESVAFLVMQVAERIGLPTVRALAQEVGVSAVYRVSMAYPDSATTDAIATLVVRHGEKPALETHYPGLFSNQPLRREWTPMHFAAFRRELRPTWFDHLQDEPNLPLFGTALCLIERAAGSFYKSVVLAPDRADSDHAVLVGLISRYLPEVFRTIPRK